MTENQKKIVEVAQKYREVREIGRNAGFSDPEFEKKMRDIGWVKGAPWCASFVRLVWLEALAEHPDLPLIRRTLGAGVVSTWSKAKMSKLLCRDLPQEGGIISWSVGLPKAPMQPGHSGIIVKVLDEMTVVTVEGNTGVTGGRDGDRVLERKRTLNLKSPRTANWRYLGTIYVP
jgi:hypothetical protein